MGCCFSFFLFLGRWGVFFFGGKLGVAECWVAVKSCSFLYLFFLMLFAWFCHFFWQCWWELLDGKLVCFGLFFFFFWGVVEFWAEDLKWKLQFILLLFLIIFVWLFFHFLPLWWGWWNLVTWTCLCVMTRKEKNCLYVIFVLRRENLVILI